MASSLIRQENLQGQPWPGTGWVQPLYQGQQVTTATPIKALPGLLAHQIPPMGNWRLWLLLAGRGSGKTTAGARWLLSDRPKHARRGIIAPTAADARDVCLEGPAG